MIKIMLVDDHGIIRDGLKRILEDEKGMQIVGEAENGIKALEVAQKTRPDVIILDISMPDMDGFDAAGSLREIVPEAKILVLTMHDSVQYAVRILEAGAHGFLRKGSVSKELFTAIRTVLAGKIYICPYISEKLAAGLRQKGKDSDPLGLLSTREFQVLRHVAQGHNLKETAKEMGISEKTVSTYRTRILEKLDFRTSADLIRYALENQLLE